MNDGILPEIPTRSTTPTLSARFAIPTSLQDTVNKVERARELERSEIQRNASELQRKDALSGMVPLMSIAGSGSGEQARLALIDKRKGRASLVGSPRGRESPVLMSRPGSTVLRPSSTANLDSAPSTALSSRPQSAKAASSSEPEPEQAEDQIPTSLIEEYISQLTAASILVVEKLPHIRWEKNGMLDLREKGRLVNRILQLETTIGETSVEITKTSGVKAELLKELDGWRKKKEGMDAILTDLLLLHRDLTARRSQYFEQMMTNLSQNTLDSNVSLSSTATTSRRTRRRDLRSHIGLQQRSHLGLNANVMDPGRSHLTLDRHGEGGLRSHFNNSPMYHLEEGMVSQRGLDSSSSLGSTAGIESGFTIVIEPTA
ncbi:hypothetical protein SpCBS45565_g02270 [Spizellomyces sp. 'palustris']|nr:hypothetical protein SpCBS45565_g02270 [Spizellomyces sp. 'palustris']